MAERHEKKRRANQGLARARLLFRNDLAWTRGFPRALFDAPGETDSEPGTRSARVASEGEGDNAILWICPDSISTNAFCRFATIRIAYRGDAWSRWGRGESWSDTGCTHTPMSSEWNNLSSGRSTTLQRNWAQSAPIPPKSPGSLPVAGTTMESSA